MGNYSDVYVQLLLKMTFLYMWGYRWAQRGDMWEASDIMQQMRQQGFAPDIHSYTSFVNACCKAGDMQVCPP
jgi:hypothetical protein